MVLMYLCVCVGARGQTRSCPKPATLVCVVGLLDRGLEATSVAHSEFNKSEKVSIHLCVNMFPVSMVSTSAILASYTIAQNGFMQTKKIMLCCGFQDSRSRFEIVFIITET